MPPLSSRHVYECSLIETNQGNSFETGMIILFSKKILCGWFFKQTNH